MKVCWNTSDVLDAIAGLPAPGPLPLRTVVVPRPRVGHRLRCSLIERGRPDLLAGTRFVTIGSLAVEVLQALAQPFREGEDRLRLPRLRVLYGRGLDPEYFTRSLVRSVPGWEDALSRTIGDLERAGLTAAGLDRVDAPVARGLALIARALDQAAGVTLTRAGLVSRAAAALAQQPDLAPAWGAVLALVTGSTEAAEADLIRAIPGVRLALRGVRPLREEYLERVESLFGSAAREALTASAPPAGTGTDLQVLRQYLFAAPEQQARPDRTRAGSEPDGSVLLEEHPGVAAELEATAAWVARQVLEHAAPLEQIAVLLPRLDPLAELVAERLRQLPWEGRFPVHVAGGIPLTSSGGGALLAVLEALRSHLSVEAVARVIPLLQPSGGDPPVAAGAALDLAQSLGTAGGSTARPEGALEWPVRAAARQEALEALVARGRAAEGDEEQAGLARGLHQSELLLRDLTAVRPALDQLVEIARAVTGGAALQTLWPQLAGFLQDWVRHEEHDPALAQLAEVVRPACEDAVCRTLAGSEALGVIEAALRGLRLQEGRFGEPAVYIGTVSGAAGLSFQAVRVIGLVDGTIPAAPQEDTVLPDEFRRRLGPRRMLLAADAALTSLHELYQVVQDTGRELVLSAPRLTLTRSYREPSAVFLEAAAALGRTVGPAGRPAGLPGLGDIRQREFAPARARAQVFAHACPLDEAAWQDRAAGDRAYRRAPAVPSAWLAPGALELDRIQALQHPAAAGSMEGLLGTDATGPLLPGTSPHRPLTASRWRTLLACPYRFLLEHLLEWTEPAAPASQRELDPLAYGSLFHGILERFFTTHGDSFWARQESLAHWQRTGAPIAAAQYAAILEQYPLAGPAVQRQQLDRLQRELRDFLAFLWSQGPSRFLAVEQAFGYGQPVSLGPTGAALHVRGFIDLLDLAGRTLRVWDIKTGRCHPRRGVEADPIPGLDAQLALYALVARQQAGRWGTPDQLQAAYAHTNDRRGRLRAFAADFAELEDRGRRWLEATAALLQERAFPRTPCADDCTWCPFTPVCGPQAASRSPAQPGAAGALGRFAEIRS